MLATRRARGETAETGDPPNVVERERLGEGRSRERMDGLVGDGEKGG